MTSKARLAAEELSHFFANREFIKAIEACRNTIEITSSLASIRDEEIAKILARRIKNSRNDTSLFLLFGGGHYQIPEMLKKQYSGNSDLKINSNISDKPSNNVQLQIAILANHGEIVPDELLARLLFTMLIQQQILNFLHKNKKASSYAKNFETVADTIDTISANLKIEDIRELFEGEKDVLEFVNNHELNAPLRNLLL